MKEYEVRIISTGVYKVFVEAEDWEAAEEVARDKFYCGEAEQVDDALIVEAEECE